MFKEAFYQSTLAQVITNEHLNSYIVNQAFCDFLGYKQEDYHALTIEQISNPDDYRLDYELFSRLVRGDIPEYTIDKRYIHKNGEEKIGRLKVSKILDRASGVHYYLGQVFDITKMKKSEKLALVGQLAAVMAHEIRNPLTPIKGFVQLLQSGMTLDEHILQLILHEINQIDRSIEEFLSIAEPLHHERQPVPLNALLAHVVEAYQVKATRMRKNIEYVPEVNGQAIIEGNIGALQHVFHHLVENALEATNEEGQIQIKLVEEIGKVQVEVKDNGCGMTEERIQRIGEPFYSTKEKGIGLGLMTSYKIIEYHDGSLDIISKRGEGTIVTITLPQKGRETS